MNNYQKVVGAVPTDYQARIHVIIANSGLSETTVRKYLKQAIENKEVIAINYGIYSPSWKYKRVV